MALFRNWLFANKRTCRMDIWTKPSTVDNQSIHFHLWSNKCFLQAHNSHKNYLVLFCIRTVALNIKNCDKLSWTDESSVMTYSSLAGNIFDLHLVEVFRNLSFVVVQRVEYFHTNKLNFTLTPQAQLSLQGTFFSFLIMLNSELCAWGVKLMLLQ